MVMQSRATSMSSRYFDLWRYTAAWRKWSNDIVKMHRATYEIPRKFIFQP